MSGFSRVKGDDQGTRRLKISSLALVIGDLVDYDRSAYVAVKATASSTVESLAGIVLENTTTSDTSVLVQKINGNDEYIVDVANNSAATDNFQRMILTDENTVNNTHTDDTTDNAVFMQLAPVGAASDKKIRGVFIQNQDRAA